MSSVDKEELDMKRWNKSYLFIFIGLLVILIIGIYSGNLTIGDSMNGEKDLNRVDKQLQKEDNYLLVKRTVRYNEKEDTFSTEFLLSNPIVEEGEYYSGINNSVLVRFPNIINTRGDVSVFSPHSMIFNNKKKREFYQVVTSDEELTLFKEEGVAEQKGIPVKDIKELVTSIRKSDEKESRISIADFFLHLDPKDVEQSDFQPQTDVSMVQDNTKGNRITYLTSLSSEENLSEEIPFKSAKYFATIQKSSQSSFLNLFPKRKIYKELFKNSSPEEGFADELVEYTYYYDEDLIKEFNTLSSEGSVMKFLSTVVSKGEVTSKATVSREMYEDFSGILNAKKVQGGRGN